MGVGTIVSDGSVIFKQRMGKGRNTEIEDIHDAARSGDLQKLQSICSSNPLAVNSRDKHSRTPYPFFFFLILFGCRNSAGK